MVLSRMKPFRLLTLSIVAAAIVPRLAHRGMFVDGVTYAAIARNLAAGRGTFWAPSYTATIYPNFHEHPPLGFWLQSLWFRALGDHWFVERLYAATIALATAWLITVVWRALALSEPLDPRQAPDDGRVEGWLPVLFWIAVPVVSWVVAGNLLENTVALFAAAAIAAAIKGARSEARAAAGWGAASGLCVVAAGLTKGPVGLFPLVAPLAFLGLPDRRRAWRALAAQWTTVAACAGLLWAWPAAREGLTDYLYQQVIAALTGQREVSAGPLTIVKDLLQGVLLPIAVATALIAAAAGRFVAPSAARRREALALLLVALAGTLPIALSAKQTGHYLVPAVPLYALAAALVMAPSALVAARRLETGSRGATLRMVSLLIIAGTFAAAASPRIGRDRALLADLDAIAAVVPRDRTIGLCPESNGEWALHAWFERRFHVALDAAGGAAREWFLQTRTGCVPASCAAATDPARPLVLMTCLRAQ